MDMQYCMSKKKVIQYVAKYATKSENRSESLKDIYATIVRNLRDDDRSLKAVQKLLMKTHSSRNMSSTIAITHVIINKRVCLPKPGWVQRNSE